MDKEKSSTNRDRFDEPLTSYDRAKNEMRSLADFKELFRFSKEDVSGEKYSQWSTKKGWDDFLGIFSKILKCEHN